MINNALALQSTKEVVSAMGYRLITEMALYACGHIIHLCLTTPGYHSMSSYQLLKVLSL